MPLEVKDKRTGKVVANGVTGNSLKCGHCDQPCLDGKTWIALDEPYHCLIHESCYSLFEFNGLPRTVKGSGREKARENMDEILTALHQMSSRPWFQKRGVPDRYKQALQQLMLVHQSLRTMGVIKDKEEKEEDK